jgi:hypothetical protein
MYKRGYQPAIEKSPALKKLIENLQALHHLQIEVLQQIDAMEDMPITEAELKRDFGFRPCSIKVLRRFGLLGELKRDGKRDWISLRQVLRTRILLAVFLSDIRLRTTRKRENIVTVLREYIEKVIGDGAKAFTAPDEALEKQETLKVA